MAGRVKRKRSYHSPRRREQAAATRRAILHAAQSRVGKARIAGVLAVIRDAAPIDRDIAALWRLIQADFYDNQRAIVESLHDKKGLRPDLDVTRATDILWTLNHPDLWLLLVSER